MECAKEDAAVEIIANCGSYILVDAEDAARVREHNWLIVPRQNTCYALMSRKYGRHYLHRFILSLPHGERICVDHVNGNGLDCRKVNLRLATWSQNAHNTPHRRPSQTGFIGVYPYHYDERFVARIRIGDRKVHLGIFNTKEEAARAYDEAAYEKIGEFAQLNFPDGPI